MKKTSLLALAGLVPVIGVVLAGGAACSRKPQSGPEAALERAYKAGILSKGEYEAKRAGLLSTPAPAPAPASASVAETPLAAAPISAAPVVAPVPPAASAPVEPPPVATSTRKAPAPVSTARVNRPRPAAPVAVAEPPAPAPAPEPAPAPVAPRVAPPAPAPAPAAVDRDDDAPATTSACPETDPRPGKEKGKQERFYPMQVAKVREAALKALKELDFSVRRASDTELEASRRRHIGLVIGSGGEKMTLQFEESVQGGQRGTRVTGETKKGFVMRAGQKSWTNAILDQTGCTLHTADRSNVSRVR